jgi:hypothetical protein
MHRISTFIGLPPHLCNPSQIDQISMLYGSPSLPRLFVAETEIHRQVGHYNTQLDGLTDARTQHSLVQLFDGELDGTKRSFQNAWTVDLDIRLDAAKLYLYAFCYLTRKTPTSAVAGVDSMTASFNLVLQQGLFVACHLSNRTAVQIDQKDCSPNGPQLTIFMLDTTSLIGSQH